MRVDPKLRTLGPARSTQNKPPPLALPQSLSKVHGVSCEHANGIEDTLITVTARDSECQHNPVI